MDHPHPETPTGGWSDEAQVEWYLERVGRLEARRHGERMLAEVLPADPADLLDLGCGDGRLAALALARRPGLRRAVLLDRSAPMLARARERFGGDPRVGVIEHDLDEALPDVGEADLVVSGFAIHHLEDDRKRSLLAEVAARLRPGGRFANLEVVASGSPRWHAEFLEAIGRTADDPEDRCATVEDQLAWMGEAGMSEVDCLWRWRGFALLVGVR